MRRSYKKGFTILELIVVISIFSILAGVVIFRFQDFEKNVDLQNLAQDIALQVAQARNDGAGGRIEPRFPNDQPSYGISFNLERNKGNNKSFVYFFDSSPGGNKDWVYTDYFVSYQSRIGCGESNRECLDVIEITSDQFIKSMCVVPDANSECKNIKDVNIIFTRPDLFAYISTSDQSVSRRGSLLEARITIGSEGGSERTVSISRNGFVGIQ